MPRKMAIPNFDEVKELLARSKRVDQSWGDLFREISSGRFQQESADSQAIDMFSVKPSLFKVLAEWDFYSSEFLDEAATDYGVKSWQVTEFVEGLREVLSISESDLIIYEKQHFTVRHLEKSAAMTPSNPTVDPGGHLTSKEQFPQLSPLALKNNLDSKHHRRLKPFFIVAAVVALSSIPLLIGLPKVIDSFQGLAQLNSRSRSVRLSDLHEMINEKEIRLIISIEGCNALFAEDRNGFWFHANGDSMSFVRLQDLPERPSYYVRRPPSLFGIRFCP